MRSSGRGNEAYVSCLQKNSARHEGRAESRWGRRQEEVMQTALGNGSMRCVVPCLLNLNHSVAAQYLRALQVIADRVPVTECAHERLELIKRCRKSAELAVSIGSGIGGMDSGCTLVSNCRFTLVSIRHGTPPDR